MSKPIRTLICTIAILSFHVEAHAAQQPNVIVIIADDLGYNGLCIRDENPFIYPAGQNLFNLQDDIGEVQNLADTHPAIARELTEAYKRWRSQMAFTKAEGGIRKGSARK